MSPDRIDINLLSLLAQQKDMRVQQGVKHGKPREIVVCFLLARPTLQSIKNVDLNKWFGN